MGMIVGTLAAALSWLTVAALVWMADSQYGYIVEDERRARIEQAVAGCVENYHENHGGYYCAGYAALEHCEYRGY